MTNERPDECQCASLGLGDIPCWECWSEGFETRATPVVTEE